LAFRLLLALLTLCPLSLLLGLILRLFELLMIRLELLLQLLHLQPDADQPVADVRLPRLLEHELVPQVRVRLFAEDLHAYLLVNHLLIDFVRVLHVTGGVL
jgi:hypothetical protein